MAVSREGKWFASSLLNYFRLLRSSADQTEETIDTQSTQSSHLRGSTPKIWNTTTTTTTTSSWKNSTPSPQSLETKLSSGRIETDDDAKPKKTKKSKLCLILWYDFFVLFFLLYVHTLKILWYKWYVCTHLFEVTISKYIPTYLHNTMSQISVG